MYIYIYICIIYIYTHTPPRLGGFRWGVHKALDVWNQSGMGGMYGIELVYPIMHGIPFYR